MTAGSSNVATATQAMSIDAGTVSVPQQTNRHATGAARLTVLGASMSAGATWTLRTRVGQSGGEMTIWLSDSSIVSLSASGVFATRRVVVTAGERAASVTVSWSYELPLVSTGRATGRLQAFNESFENVQRSGGTWLGMEYEARSEEDTIEVHVGLARVTLAASQCQYDSTSTFEMAGSSIYCAATLYDAPRYNSSSTPDWLLQAKHDVEQARERSRLEQAVIIARNASGCADSGTCLDGYDAGNLTVLEDNYYSLWRFDATMEGCNAENAPPDLARAMLPGTLASRTVSEILRNCTDFFLDMSFVARVPRTKSVQTVSPHLLAVGGSAKSSGDVVTCVQKPMNGAFRRVQIQDTSIQQELARAETVLEAPWNGEAADEIRSCVSGAYNPNATRDNIIVFLGGIPCEASHTTWTSSSSLLCGMPDKSDASLSLLLSQRPRVVVEVVFSTLVSPFYYGLPRDGANLPSTFAMHTRISGSGFAAVDTTMQVRVGGGGFAGGGGGGGFTGSESTWWVSDSTVVGKMAQKMANTHMFTMTAGMKVGTVSEAVSYDRFFIAHICLALLFCYRLYHRVA